MTQRAIDGNFVYFVTTNTTYREIFFVDEQQAELLGQIIRNACRLKHFELLGYCILPDHVHLLVNNNNTPQRGIRIPRCGWYTLSDLMHSIKRNFARQQPHSGRLWQPRFNFRIIDSEARLYRTIEYIRYNYRKNELPEIFGQAPWVYIDWQAIQRLQ